MNTQIQQIFQARNSNSKLIPLDRPSLIISGDNKKGSLWLGDYLNASNEEFLRVNQIKVVVTVAKNLKINLNSEITHKIIPVLDNESSSLLCHFQEVNKFIDEQLIQCKNVLVHCHLGVSRSPTIVIAYLMFKYQLTKQKAHNFVKEKRSQINPNKGFMYQLEKFEEIALKQKKPENLPPKPPATPESKSLLHRQVRLRRIETNDQNEFYQVYMKQLKNLSPQLLYTVSSQFNSQKPNKNLLDQPQQIVSNKPSEQKIENKISRTQRTFKSVSQSTYMEKNNITQIYPKNSQNIKETKQKQYFI